MKSEAQIGSYPLLGGGGGGETAHTVCDDIRADSLRCERNLAVRKLILEPVTTKHTDTHDSQKTNDTNKDVSSESGKARKQRRT